MKFVSCLKWQFSWWFIDLAKYVTRCVKTSLKSGEKERGERTLNHFKLLLKFLSAMTYLNDSHQIWRHLQRRKNYIAQSVPLSSIQSNNRSTKWNILTFILPLQQRQLLLQNFFMTFFFLLNFVWFHFPLLTSNLEMASATWKDGLVTKIAMKRKMAFSGLNRIQCCCCCWKGRNLFWHVKKHFVVINPILRKCVFALDRSPQIVTKNATHNDDYSYNYEIVL